MKMLRIYFKGYLKETILGPLFKLLEAAFELSVPLIIAEIVDHIIPAGDKKQLYIMLFVLFLFASVGIVVSITAQYFSAKAAVGFTKQMTENLFSKVISLSQKERDEVGIDSLVARLTSDSFQIQTGINQFLRLFLRAPIIVCGAVIMSFIISPRIAPYFVGMVILLVVLVSLISGLLGPVYTKIRQATDKLVSLTRQQMQGVRVIRAFNQTENEEKDFAALNEDYTKLQIRAGRLSSMMTPLTFLTVNIALILVIYQGGWSIENRLLSQGQLIALINYLLQILTELLKTTLLVASLNQALISAGRIRDVLGKVSEAVDAPLEQNLSDDNLALSVHNLSFTYPRASSPALEDINFEVKTGSFFGIIGGTGSGKTSLIQLLIHLYRPQSGSLTLFHQKRSPKNLSEWRQWVGLVPQKAELFQGTVRSNLLLGQSRKISDKELWQALSIAQASDFIKALDLQLDSPVAAFGRNFSGGQRQRLTIARAILGRPPFLILDDATSALDYLTESRLLSALKENLTNTTLIMVSQRTGSLKTADSILLLDKGRQAAFGSHRDLLNQSQLYRAIDHSQHRS
ncbi:ABC transporter ATP-binding protein [Streptococcus sp. H49]|uniref:ABC transporter ATP-binding protein n=1 Tax=Streptococcus huangxiaojuni TaxID=3237239 RepID=UPI0034A1EAEE